MLDLETQSCCMTVIKELIPDVDDNIFFPTNTYGIFRLWNHDTHSPTNLYLLLGEYDSVEGEITVEEEDEAIFNEKICGIMTYAKVCITDYSLLGKRVRGDICIPYTTLQKYLV